MSNESDLETDPERIASIRRLTDQLVAVAHGQPSHDVQLAIANLVTRVALSRGTEIADRVFLETIDQAFSVYRMASNLRLRNEDPAVS